MIYFLFGTCLIFGAMISVFRENWDSAIYFIALVIFFYVSSVLVRPTKKHFFFKKKSLTYGQV